MLLRFKTHSRKNESRYTKHNSVLESVDSLNLSRFHSHFSIKYNCINLDRSNTSMAQSNLAEELIRNIESTIGE